MNLFKKKPSELEETLADLLVLVNKTGITLQQNRAIVEEHNGSVEDLRKIVRMHGEIGDVMRRAVARTRLRFPTLEES